MKLPNDDFWKAAAESGTLPTTTTPVSASTNIADFWKKVREGGALPVTTTPGPAFSTPADFFQYVAEQGVLPIVNNGTDYGNVQDYLKAAAANGALSLASLLSSYANVEDMWGGIVHGNIGVPFSDGFGGLSGHWTGAGFAVAGGVATISPTAGSEIVSNGGFAANTTGWDVTASSLASIAGGQAGNCLEVTRVSGTAQAGWQALTLSPNSWYLYTVYVKSGSSGNETYAIYAQRNGPAFTPVSAIAGTSTASWVLRYLACRPDQAAMRITLEKQSATAGTMLFDTASVVPLTLSTQFATVVGSADCTAQVKITLSGVTQAGIVVNLDSPSNPQNFIVAYIDGFNSRCWLDECVNGTITNKISAAAITYGAGKILKVVRSGNSCSVYYDGVQVGTTQTMTANTNTRHGLFSTYSGNTFDDFSLTNP